MQRDIYLDNSATTKPFDAVVDHMNEISRYFYGNPSSLHIKGIEAERKINEARDKVAKSIGVNSKQIIFTSGGTESNNLAIRGCLDGNPRKGRHIITTRIEHPSILEVFKQLESIGYKLDYINVSKDGRLILDDLRAKMSDQTALVSIMLVNNEMGAIQPVEEASVIIKSINRNTVLHVDAIQAFGKMRLNPVQQGIDLMSVSSHKINGPKGIGALFIANGLKMKPILFGGGQESLMRSGTENVSGISGFGLAVEMTYNRLDETISNVKGLKAAFIEGLKDTSFIYNIISQEYTSPYILNISFEGLKSEVLLHHLEERRIFVSAGSACSSRKITRSHVLQAMGLQDTIIDSAIRFSFSSMNTKNDIIETISALQDIVPVLQKNRRKR